MKHIASVSFGKDSLAMLFILIKLKYPLDAAVFYDTGMEFECIYKIRDKVRPLLDAHGVEFVELYPDEPFLYSMFEREVKNRDTDGFHYGYSWCGGVCRWGTARKISTINKYKASLGCAVVDYVGIAADEKHRFDKSKSEGKRMPLVEWGMTEADCLAYCYERGFFWDENGVRLYDILDRVSCWCCANKNRKELKNIYINLPDYWNKLKELQARTDRPMKKFIRSGVPYGNVFEMEKVFITEIKEEHTNGKTQDN